MTVFEICMIIMAVSTVVGALTAAAKNLAHVSGVRKAQKIAERAELGAEVGAVIGAALAAVIHPKSAEEAKETARQNKRLLEIHEQMTEVIQRQEKELAQARRPPARLWVWLKAQFPKKAGA